MLGTFFLVAIGIAVMGLSSVTLSMAAIGYAAITSGCPNLNPSINTWVLGRKNYLVASRIIMARQGVIAAFANSYMGTFLNTGKVSTAYYVLCIAVVVTMILLGVLARKPAYDSEKAIKTRETVI